eukprot:TRINITY_DN15330_c0_g1_i1.p1 TRINITY_DN15330_c0_g1~~TRINITY_DN15330_c0_g1_i1.p1  ORF type:complete len:205 (-),score=43.64 TRINITY_DN15330_c0_g1_i1:72-686(-)
MLLPMPEMPMQLGAPTSFAIRQRPWLAAVLVLQSLVCLLRFAVLCDVIGGILMMFMVGIGWYAWREVMNITYICCWGIICFVNSTLDFVRLLEIALKKPEVLFTKGGSVKSSWDVGVLIAIPIVGFLGALQAWFLYQDHEQQDVLSRSLTQQGDRWASQAGYGAAPPRAAPQARQAEQRSAGGQDAHAGRPQSFQGRGQRLDDP